MHAASSSVRVMVVEDFQSFRQFVCSTLEQRSDLRVICEVSDGLDAVRKAEELKPDLICLTSANAEWYRGSATNSRPSAGIEDYLCEPGNLGKKRAPICDSMFSSITTGLHSACVVWPIRQLPLRN